MGLNGLSDATRALISAQFYTHFTPMSSSSSSSPSSQIDVYSCPPRSATGHINLAYAAAVMAAAASGAPVQLHCGQLEWCDCAVPAWNWEDRVYRINPASRPVAPKPEACCKPIFKAGDWVMFAHAGHCWPHAKKLTAIYGNSTQLDLTFFCLLANLRHAAPEEIPPPPKLKRIPLTAADLTGGAIWIRWSNTNRDTHRLAVTIDSKQVTLTPYDTLPYGYLMRQGGEWSNDRITWKPCYREVPSE